MRGFGKIIGGLRGKVFYRKGLLPQGGIPYVLGQGLDIPCAEPGLRVHWHPPFSVMVAEEPAARKTGIGHLFEKLGFKRKSA